MGRVNVADALAFVGIGVWVGGFFGCILAMAAGKPAPHPSRLRGTMYYVSVDRAAIDRNAAGDTIEPVICIQYEELTNLEILVDEVVFESTSRLVYDPHHQRFPSDPKADTVWVQTSALRYCMNGVWFNLP